jgi:flavin-dependent dehydrogenase
MNSNDRKVDVAVIGGGPAGAAAGTQLARAGLSVLILEKEKFPRFCIGESLLPHGNDILRELGVWDQLDRAGFLRKYGAEFLTADKSRLQRFWFRHNLGPEREHTYQVERASFDKLLLDHAKTQGCEVREQTRVLGLDQPDTENMTLNCESADGSRSGVRARWVIDASGRCAFAGTRAGLRRRSTQRNRRVAIYGHFEGVFRNSGKAEGHITIVRLPECWFWFIPLAGDRTSVGLVVPSERLAGGEKISDVFAAALEQAPEAADRMRHAASVSPLRATGDYSWKFSSFATRRIVLTGDAAGFVDPVFSSGVLLALKSGMQAAKMIAKADAAGRPLGFLERTAYTRDVTRWMKQYVRIIRMFYDRAGFEVFMNPVALLNIPSSIGRLVGGDTQPGIADSIRMLLFRLICRLQRVRPIAPAIPSLR